MLPDVWLCPLCSLGAGAAPGYRPRVVTCQVPQVLAGPTTEAWGPFRVTNLRSFHLVPLGRNSTATHLAGMA